jgi:putative FmdB family regulatory protein
VGSNPTTPANFNIKELIEMPTYTYKCEGKCENFEMDQRITEDPIKKCPTCDKPVARVIGCVGLIVKCSGFFGKSK